MSSGQTVTISDYDYTIDNVDHDGLRGGGIHNDHGDLTVSNCTLSGTRLQQAPRAAASLTTATRQWPPLTITNSTLRGNLATTAGGGISNYGGLTASANAVGKQLHAERHSVGNGTAGGGIFNDGYKAAPR